MAHTHRCQKCGTPWTHGDMLAGDIEAHTCPKCQEPGQWRIYRNPTPPVGRIAFGAKQVSGSMLSLFMNPTFWGIVFVTAGVVIMLDALLELISRRG